MTEKVKHSKGLIAVSIIISTLAFLFLPAWIAWLLLVALILSYYLTIYEIFGPFGPP